MLTDGSTHHFPMAHIYVWNKYCTGMIETLLLSRDKYFLENTYCKMDNICDNIAEHKKAVCFESKRYARKDKRGIDSNTYIVTCCLKDDSTLTKECTTSGSVK